MLTLTLWVLAAPAVFLAQAPAPATQVKILTSSVSGAASLLLPGNLLYQGAFRIPRGAFGDPHGDGLTYPDSGLTYNPANNSLFINGHVWWQLTAEISIPQVVNSTNLASLNTATVRQNLTDVTEGHLANIYAGGTPTRDPLLGGLLVYNGKLIGTSYEYYDGSNLTRLSHFTSSLNLAQTGDFQGMYLVGDPLKTAFVSAYMALVPAAWQASLGGPALTGNCCVSIISRSSWGPAASAFDPDKLGVVSPVPVTPLVEYTSANPLGASLDQQSNPYFEQGDEMRGLVFAAGARSLLFFGRHGTGPFCYGEGTANPALDHTAVPGSPGVIYCYDPVITSKGSHSYPYAHYVWAYDANDLAAAKAGTKQPWQVRPYAVWTLGLPSAFGIAGYAGIQGAAYDPSTQRIYVSQKLADGSLPLIHVFTVVP